MLQSWLLASGVNPVEKELEAAVGLAPEKEFWSIEEDFTPPIRRFNDGRRLI